MGEWEGGEVKWESGRRDNRKEMNLGGKLGREVR